MNNHQFCFAIGLFLAIGIIAINSHVLPEPTAKTTWICNDNENNRKIKIVFVSLGILYLKNEVLEKIYGHMQLHGLDSTIEVNYDRCSDVPDIGTDPINWKCVNKASKQLLMGYSKSQIQDTSCPTIPVPFKFLYW